MEHQLKNKNIVIIGGTSGIGLSAAKAFVAEGANIVVLGKQVSVDEAKLHLTNNTIVLEGDATQPGIAMHAVDTCIKNYGGLDGLYHVAGGSGRKMGDGPLHELTLEGWNKTIELNLTSIMLSNQAAVIAMLKLKKSGSILNMGSVLASRPAAHFFATHAYATAKAGIIGFSKSVAAYYASNNIRVNVVAPSLVETPMSKRAANDKATMNFVSSKQPLDDGRIGKPADLDGIAVYFMSDQSIFTTAQVLTVDGGWSVTDGQY